MIGRRFCLVLVKRGQNQFEVSTFRKKAPKTHDKSKSQSKIILNDNAFGTPIEDAHRRDFTINALFYDPFKDKLIDYCDGLKDIQLRTIRMIGDPYMRIPEDPIRILRSLRLAHKLQFSINPLLRQAISTLSQDISLSALPRKREEMLKILRLHNPILAFQEIYDLQVMKYAWPRLHKILASSQSKHTFWHYFQCIADLKQNDQKVYKNPHQASSLEIFALLTLSLLVAQGIYDPLKIVSTGTYSEDVQLKKFMKEELGMSGLEIGRVLRGLEILPLLKDKYKIFKTWRRTRQRKFLRQKGFSVALYLAAVEQTVPYWDILSWTEASQKVL